MMPVVKIDMDFCRSMGDAAKHPDVLSPKRPDECKAAPIHRRLYAAWLVLMGRADALVWPE